MEEKKKCMCGCSDVSVVACCGASNVGQIANQAHAEIEPAIQIIVTELGIEKSHEIKVDGKYCSMVVEKVKEEMGYKKPEPNSCLNRGDKVYDYTE